MTTEDYETVLHEAERALQQAQTAAEVRALWRKHFGVLGHRTLGRLLLGRPSGELLSRREARAERD